MVLILWFLQKRDPDVNINETVDAQTNHIYS